MTSRLSSENKQEEYLQKIEAEFRSTLDKRFGEIDVKFSEAAKEKKMLRPRILGGEPAPEVEVPQEVIEVGDKQLSPSPTVEEIALEPQAVLEHSESQQQPEEEEQQEDEVRSEEESELVE